MDARINLNVFIEEDYFDKEKETENSACSTPTGCDVELTDFKKKLPHQAPMDEPRTPVPQVEQKTPRSRSVTPPKLSLSDSDDEESCSSLSDAEDIPVLPALVRRNTFLIPKSVDTIGVIHGPISDTETITLKSDEPLAIIKGPPIEDKDGVSAAPPPVLVIQEIKETPVEIQLTPTKEQKSSVSSLVEIKLTPKAKATTSSLEQSSPHLADLIPTPAITRPANSGFQPQAEKKRTVCEKLWQLITCASCCDENKNPHPNLR